MEGLPNEGVDEIFIALDVSGSTRNNASYEQKSRSIEEGLRAKHSNAIFTYIAWADFARVITRDEFIAYTYGERDGNGTAPEYFIDLIPEKDTVRLVVITDGQISNSSVQACARKLKQRSFKQAVFHFLHTGGQMDVSVAAPFICKTEFALFKDLVPFSSGNTLCAVEVEPFFSQEPEAFIANWIPLKSAIIAQNLVAIDQRNAVTLYDRLLALQSHLLRTLALRKTDNQLNKTVLEELRQGRLPLDDWSVFVKSIPASQGGVEMSLERQVEAIIQELCKACRSTGNFSFTQFTNREIRAAPLAAAPVDQLPAAETEHKIECIISLDEDSPVIGITQGPAVLADLPKEAKDSYMTNPLGIFFSPELMAKLRARLDSALGLESAKTLFAQRGEVKSPTTRQTLATILPTGCHLSHIEASNAALASIFFGSNKLVGQENLWLFVVHEAIGSTEYLRPACDALEEHMRFRAFEQTTNATLCGLPIVPNIKVPVALAVFHSLHSALLFDGKLEETNRLVGFGASARHLLLYNNVLRLPVDERVPRLIDTYSTVREHLKRVLHDGKKMVLQPTLPDQIREFCKAVFDYSTGTAVYKSAHVGEQERATSYALIMAGLVGITHHNSMSNVATLLCAKHPLFQALFLGYPIDQQSVVQYLNQIAFDKVVLPPMETISPIFATPYGCSVLYLQTETGGRRFFEPNTPHTVLAPNPTPEQLLAMNKARKNVLRAEFHVKDVAPCAESWIYNGVHSVATHYSTLPGNLGLVPQRRDTLAILKLIFADGRGYVSDPRLLRDVVNMQASYLATRSTWLAKGLTILDMTKHRITFDMKAKLELQLLEGVLPAQFPYSQPVYQLDETLLQPLTSQEVDLVYSPLKLK